MHCLSEEIFEATNTPVEVAIIVQLELHEYIPQV